MQRTVHLVLILIVLTHARRARATNKIKDDTSGYTCDFSGEPTHPPQIKEDLTKQISNHMGRFEKRLARTSGCPIGSECPSSWLKTEGHWRERALRYEGVRLCTHARLFGNFLPTSRTSLKKVPAQVGAYLGAFSPFDYYEPEFACSDEQRVPERLGDGPKWVCGLTALPKPCSLVSLGSNFDDSFERAVHALAGCNAYIVDPTLHIAASRPVEPGSARRPTPSVEEFRQSLLEYGAHLNETVGVGRPSGDGAGGTTTLFTNTITQEAEDHEHAKKKNHTTSSSFTVVGLSELLTDKYGSPPWRVHLLKMDIEGSELHVLREMGSLCAKGQLIIDQLNVEMHAYPAWFPESFQRFGELYEVLVEPALSCKLVLHHKERNSWGCPLGQCLELAWTSLAHARSVAAGGR